MGGTWLITGAGGQLGSVLLHVLIETGEDAVGIASPRGPAPKVDCKTARLDLCDFDSVRRIVMGIRPDCIVHAAAITQVQAAFENPALAVRTNVDATKALAEIAGELGARFAYLSTDLVFDGENAPYAETAEPRPLSVYGRSKLDGEDHAKQTLRGLVLRLPLMYGLPFADRPTTFMSQVNAIKRGDDLRLFEDEFRSPICLEDAAKSCIEATRSDCCGVLHVGGSERLSRLEMGRITAKVIGSTTARIVAIRREDMPFAEARPRDVSLDSSRFERIFGHPAGRRMEDAMQSISMSLSQ